MAPDYDGKIFASVSNSPSGDVSSQTLFHYHEQDGVVWATYAGGPVRFGTLVATQDADGVLDMRYQHVSTSGELKTGVCRSEPELLPDGRLRLRENWRWTSGDGASGSSIVEELRR